MVFFFIIAFVEIFAEFKENEKIIYVTKPFVMPLLILFYIFGVIESGSIAQVDWFIVIALIGGWGGDIFLMLKNEDKWFLPGMGSFLINQIFYTIAFFLSITDFAALNLWGLFLILPALLILIFTVPRFVKNTGDMKIPVLVYMAAILLMHIAALLRIVQFQGLPFILVYVGSLSYIFSDAMLASNKWTGEFTNARSIVMSTYFMAQFYITLGALFSSLL
ncbi:hypothetical protein LCGC14_1122220 [marine sediment metagenome]|uniref:YhhN-like protein n=1 Tax=marine sediment metagenome TaxID=412755 RepID=A0A0F9PLU1_9ZZZZ